MAVRPCPVILSKTCLNLSGLGGGQHGANARNRSTHYGRARRTVLQGVEKALQPVQPQVPALLSAQGSVRVVAAKQGHGDKGGREHPARKDDVGGDLHVRASRSRAGCWNQIVALSLIVRVVGTRSLRYLCSLCWILAIVIH